MQCDDGSPATPCCGYGKCYPSFPPCCACDDGCRSLLPPEDCNEELSARLMSDNESNTAHTKEFEYSVGPSGISLRPLGNITDDHGNIPSNNTFPVRLVANFGVDEVVITAIRISGKPGQTFHLATSDDGFRWKWQREEFGNRTDSTMRLETGRVLTRHVMMQWLRFFQPTEIVLYGCTPDSEETLHPAKDAMLIFGTGTQCAVGAIALMMICSGCITLCMFIRSWKRRHSAREQDTFPTDVPLLPLNGIAEETEYTEMPDESVPSTNL